MTKLTKSAIEDFAIKLFARLGCAFINDPDGENTLPTVMSGEVRVEV